MHYKEDIKSYMLLSLKKVLCLLNIIFENTSIMLSNYHKINYTLKTKMIHLDC